LEVGETIRAAVVAPVFQVYVLAPEAFRFALLPEQSVELAPEMLIVGLLMTVTVTTVFFVQLFAAVPVTVYDVFAVGFTASAAVVAPVFHE
jgi:hypothetical protein